MENTKLFYVEMKEQEITPKSVMMEIITKYLAFKDDINVDEWLNFLGKKEDLSYTEESFEIEYGLVRHVYTFLDKSYIVIDEENNVVHNVFNSDLFNFSLIEEIVRKSIFNQIQEKNDPALNFCYEYLYKNHGQIATYSNCHERYDKAFERLEKKFSFFFNPFCKNLFISRIIDVKVISFTHSKSHSKKTFTDSLRFVVSLKEIRIEFEVSTFGSIIDIYVY